eukprot:361545-Chlamydomonas_euryale.AAC.5
MHVENTTWTQTNNEIVSHASPSHADWCIMSGMHRHAARPGRTVAPFRTHDCSCPLDCTIARARGSAAGSNPSASASVSTSREAIGGVALAVAARLRGSLPADAAPAAAAGAVPGGSARSAGP